ncbi:MAG: response regulator transcription factor [Clostridiales bacterium]|nr:response regulator transcription factor [Clostridiales bacterium]
MGKHILIVDDEPLIVKGLKFSLEQDDYQISAAFDGEEAIKCFEDENVDLILLDVMLPKIDGLEVCRRIRATSSVPIIMITAKGEDMDKILGLEYGADDYIIKPFNILEVKARIKTILRRAGSENFTRDKEKVLHAKDMTVDLNKRTVMIKGKEIPVTAKEFDILHLLISNPGVVYKREELLEMIWKYDYVGDVRTVDVHIRRLRKKIEVNPDEPEYVYTKWGVGYYFTDK